MTDGELAILAELHELRAEFRAVDADKEARIRSLEKRDSLKRIIASAVVAAVTSIATVFAGGGCGARTESPVYVPEAVVTPAQAEAATVRLDFLRDEPTPIQVILGDIGWMGSGGFLADELVLTAGHVCPAEGEAGTFTVTDSTGQEYEAYVIVREDDPDLCLVGVPGAMAPLTYELADGSTHLGFGSPLWYVGRPDGQLGMFQGTFSQFTDEWAEQGLQGLYILAAIPGWGGSSGSLVMDTSGKVVGVVSATASSNGITLLLVPVEFVYDQLISVVSPVNTYGS